MLSLRAEQHCHVYSHQRYRSGFASHSSQPDGGHAPVLLSYVSARSAVQLANHLNDPPSPALPPPFLKQMRSSRSVHRASAQDAKPFLRSFTLQDQNRLRSPGFNCSAGKEGRITLRAQQESHPRALRLLLLLPQPWGATKRNCFALQCPHPALHPSERPKCYFKSKACRKALRWIFAPLITTKGLKQDEQETKDPYEKLLNIKSSTLLQYLPTL